MSTIGVTVLDPIVLLVTTVSIAYAIYRGFVAETLSVFAWVAAGFATLLFGPKLAPISREWVGAPSFGVVLGDALIFLVIFVPLSFVGYRLADANQNTPVSALDRTMGGAFGAVRGLAIIGVAYILFSHMALQRIPPNWIANAKTLPVIRGSAEVLAALVPDQHFEDGKAAIKENPRSTLSLPVPIPKPSRAAAHRPAPTASQTSQQTAALKPTQAVAQKPAQTTAQKKARPKAYDAKERSELDRLIEQTGGNNL